VNNHRQVLGAERKGLVTLKMTRKWYFLGQMLIRVAEPTLLELGRSEGYFQKWPTLAEKREIRGRRRALRQQLTAFGVSPDQLNPNPKNERGKLTDEPIWQPASTQHSSSSS
jgi:hypothetical protein